MKGKCIGFSYIPQNCRVQIKSINGYNNYMNIVKIFLFSSLVFLLPLTSHSVDCDKLYKEKGFLCVGSVGKGKWKKLNFTYKTSKYDSAKIIVKVTNDSSKTYDDVEFHFGWYDKDFELIHTDYNLSHDGYGLFKKKSERQIGILGPVGYDSVIRYIKLDRVQFD